MQQMLRQLLLLHTECPQQPQSGSSGTKEKEVSNSKAITTELYTPFDSNDKAEQQINPGKHSVTRE
jgi:hypothetical protein